MIEDNQFQPSMALHFTVAKKIGYEQLLNTQDKKYLVS